MGRYCTICRHPAVADINAAIVMGTSMRSIGKLYGFSGSAICRHKNTHIGEALLKAAEAAQVEREEAVGQDLLVQVRGLLDRTQAILRRAERQSVLAKTSADRDRFMRTALTAIKEMRGSFELLAKLTGELSTGSTVNVLVSAEWVDLRTQILQAVEPYPDARLAIIEAVAHAAE